MALYLKAAEILEKVEQKRGAVKTLVYDSKFQVSPDIFVAYIKIWRNWGSQLWSPVSDMI